MNKHIKESIIKDTAKYNFAQYFSQFFGFFSAIAMRRFLGPYLMGIWSLLGVVINCFSFMDLGVGAAAAYKIPFLKGKGDKKAEAEVKDSAFSFLFLISLLSSVMVIIACCILKHRLPAVFIAGLIFLSVYLVLHKIYSYYIMVLRANSNFSVISLSVIFDAVVNLCLILLLVSSLKIYGLYIAAALMAVLNTMFVHFFARYRINFSFKPKRIFSLIKFGFPLLLLGSLGTILGSIDRIMIAKMIGVTFVGYYSVAIMAKNCLIGITNNFGIVTLPRIMEAYGKEENIKHIEKFVTLSAEAISYLLPYFLGVIFLTTPLFVTKILPKFIPGILAAQILLLDIFFRSCCPQAESFLIALGKQVRIIPITAVAITLNVFLNYIFIVKGYGIYGVALGTSIASFLNFLVILVYAMRHFSGRIEIFVFISKIMFPLVYIGSVIISCAYFLNIRNPYVQLTTNIVILTIASLPLFIHIDRRTHILRILFRFLWKAKTK